MDIFAIIYILSVFVLVGTVSAFWTEFLGAPWIPSERKVVDTMLRLAEVGPDDLVYDLGCGDGRLVIAAARKYGARAVGVEIDPLRYLWCQLVVALLGLRGRVQIVFGNLFSIDLGEATVVTCFLRQRTNNKLEDKLIEELQPGTRVVSNVFIFPTMPAVAGEGNVRLYLFFADRLQGLKQSVNNKIPGK